MLLWERPLTYILCSSQALLAYSGQKVRTRKTELGSAQWMILKMGSVQWMISKNAFVFLQISFISASVVLYFLPTLPMLDILSHCSLEFTSP